MFKRIVGLLFAVLLVMAVAEPPPLLASEVNYMDEQHDYPALVQDSDLAVGVETAGFLQSGATATRLNLNSLQIRDVSVALEVAATPSGKPTEAGRTSLRMQSNWYDKYSDKVPPLL